MVIRPIVLFTTAALLLPPSVLAQVYKCITPDGLTEYRQTPCSEGPGGETRQSDKTLPIPALPGSSYSGGATGLRPSERALLDRLEQEEAERQHRQTLRTAANRGKVLIGMSASQVRRAWGAPDDINRTITGRAIAEQWVYRCGRFCARYVYLRNGEVTSLQD